MKNAREIALDALIRYRRAGTWPDLWLKGELARGVSEMDAAFATALVYGTLERLRLIDWIIDGFSHIKRSKISPVVLDALRLGVYQLAFMTRVPHSAAVNEMTGIVKRRENPRAVAFCNAVLRAVSVKADSLPEPEGDDLTAVLALKTSHMDWFVGKMRKKLGDDGARALLAANGRPERVCARVNTRITTRQSLIDALAGQGIAAEAHETLPDAIVLAALGGALHTGEFEDGHFYIQDSASQMCVLALAPQPGDTLYDLCAAPGGKSIMAAQLMECKGKILAMDIHAHKADLIAQNARKYHAECIVALPHDATVHVPSFDQTADRVLCDVPCSGTGVIAKKPDIRYKAWEDVAALPALQRAILENAARYVKPGGTLVYSTCSVLTEENEAVVTRFLEENTAYAPAPFALANGRAAPDGFVTLYPHTDGTDGFFIAKMQRRA